MFGIDKMPVSELFVFSDALAWNGNHFIIHTGNNSNKKMSKTYNIRINSGMCKKSIEYLASPVSAQNKNITALLLYVAPFIGKNVTSM
jgi:hypothetical protein